LTGSVVGQGALYSTSAFFAACNEQASTSFTSWQPAGSHDASYASRRENRCTCCETEMGCTGYCANRSPLDVVAEPFAI
jgi:hypothetical protein